MRLFLSAFEKKESKSEKNVNASNKITITNNPRTRLTGLEPRRKVRSRLKMKVVNYYATHVDLDRMSNAGGKNATFETENGIKYAFTLARG